MKQKKIIYPHNRQKKFLYKFVDYSKKFYLDFQTKQPQKFRKKFVVPKKLKLKIVFAAFAT